MVADAPVASVPTLAPVRFFFGRESTAPDRPVARKVARVVGQVVVELVAAVAGVPRRPFPRHCRPGPLLVPVVAVDPCTE